MPTKKELIDENEELREALARMRDEIDDLIGDDGDDEPEEPEDED